MSNFDTLDDWLKIHTDGTCKEANDCLITLAQSIQKTGVSPVASAKHPTPTMSTVDIDKPYEQSSLEKAIAQQRTHLKAELLAKMPEPLNMKDYPAESECYNQALTEITKIIEEL